MLFTLFTLGALAVSATKAGLENMDCRTRTYTLPNGQRYWMDRQGRCRLCSNDKLIFSWGDGVWKDEHYNIICDRDAIERQEQRKKAITEGRLSYDCYTERTGGHRAVVEVSTGKVIAKMERRQQKDGSFECRKWYLYDIYAVNYPGHENYCHSVMPNNYDWKDEGIVISETEFEGLLPTYSLAMIHIKDDKDWKNNRR